MLAHQMFWALSIFVSLNVSSASLLNMQTCVSDRYSTQACPEALEANNYFEFPDFLQFLSLEEVFPILSTLFPHHFHSFP